MDALAEKIQKTAKLIQQADNLIIATGAGMGIDSGLPDFRGADGFWKAYPALKLQNRNFKEIANPESFNTMPEIAWGFYGHRLQLYRNTIPHAGFHILKKWGERLPRGYSVFTSNVDGQFQKAGFLSSRIHECHGSIHHLQCKEACTPYISSAENFIPQLDVENCQLLNAPPVCIHCCRIARPNILMFNDSKWLEYRTENQAMVQHAWLSSVHRPVVIELGAGTSISTVRNFSERTIRRYNGHLVRINPTEPHVSRPDDISLPMTALRALTLINDALGIAMDEKPV